MRFIRQEEIITTVCNQEVKENEYIARLLEKLAEEGIYFTLSLKKLYLSDYNERTIVHSKVKVKEVRPEEAKVDFYVYKEKSLIRLNAIPFNEISEIFALTKKTNLLECNTDKGIFAYIDLED